MKYQSIAEAIANTAGATTEHVKVVADCSNIFESNERMTETNVRKGAVI
jgi:hypothetical protein